MKELVHDFSCTYIELWMHLGSQESTQEARIPLGYASRNSYASPRASITQYTHAKHEPILNSLSYILAVLANIQQNLRDNGPLSHSVIFGRMKKINKFSFRFLSKNRSLYDWIFQSHSNSTHSNRPHSFCCFVTPLQIM